MNVRELPASADRARPTIEAVVARIRTEFVELPGLRLTPWQAQRLWHLEKIQCDAILAALVDAAFLRRTPDGSYVRANRPL